MTLEIATDDDILYLRLLDGEVVKTKRIGGGIIFDFDASGQVIGIEVMHATARFGGIEGLTAEAVLANALGDWSRQQGAAIAA